MNMIHTNLEFYKALFSIFVFTMVYYVMHNNNIALSKLWPAFGSIVVCVSFSKDHTTIYLWSKKCSLADNIVMADS